MKKIFLIPAVVFLVIILVLVKIASSSGSGEQGALKKTPGGSVYKDQVKIEYSKSFEVEYFDSAKIVKVFSPDKNRTLIFSYLLLPQGKTAPKGFENYQVINVPVKSAISLSSIYIGFMERLGILDKLIGVDTYDYIVSPQAKALIKKNNIQVVGSTINLNTEKVFAMNPGILLTYGNGNPVQDGHQKLIQNGIRVASSTSHLEITPLARAEWIKFVAVFFDQEKRANEVFDSVKNNYQKLTALASKAGKKPTVFTDEMYGGKWYEPGGNSFVATMIKDAGGDYVWGSDKSTGSLKLDYEQVYEKAHDADVWINVHYWTKKSDVIKADPRYSKFKAYAMNTIFNSRASVNEFGGNELWESGIINCDVVLADMIKIFHPELVPEHQFKYYKKLADN